MQSRERVLATIRHEKVDRMPVYGWIEWNMKDAIAQRFGGIEALEDYYEFDLVHLFGGPDLHQKDEISEWEKQNGRRIEPPDYLDLPLHDPNQQEDYQKLVEDIRHHRDERGRFVYIQTPGILECLNGVFGIENHLRYLAEFPEVLQKIYQRQAQWNRTFAMNCIDLGVDMVHVSDDWGAQDRLMISPRTWWKLIYPNHLPTCQAVTARGIPLSLHSDGNINSVIDGILQLGYQVVHPWQESAGMSLQNFKENYSSRLVVMGGLDVQTTIGFGKIDFLVSEIRRILSMFADGGLIFCTTHFIQEHCSIEELVTAYDLVYELVHQESKKNKRRKIPVNRRRKKAAGYSSG